MLTSLMSAELVAARHTELIAAADAERLARQVRRARRDERRLAVAARIRRTWLRSGASDARPATWLTTCTADRREPACLRSAGVAVGDNADVQPERA